MNQLDSIEELYNMYSEKEESPRIVKVAADDLDFDSDNENGWQTHTLNCRVVS